MIKIGLFTLLLLVSAQGWSKPLKIGFSSDLNTPGSIPQDAVSRILIHALEQIPSSKLKYDFIGLSRARERQLVQSGADLCLYNKVKNKQRVTYLQFSRYPISAFPPNRLIVKQPNRLPTDIELAKVLRERQLQIGIADGRSYGAELDIELKTLKAELFTLSGFDADMRLMKMLLSGKIDGMIDFSAAFFSRKGALVENDQTQYSVHRLSTASRFIFGYVACVKNDLGKAVISLIDEALVKPEVFENMVAIFQRQFPKEEAPFVIQALQRMYGENKKGAE